MTHATHAHTAYLATPPAITAYHPHAVRPAFGVSLAGIDPTFDFVVSLMSPRFRISEHQFPDFAAMREDFNRTGILTVNCDFSERTIYGTAWTNYQFRAWHDSAHIACDSDFSGEGELRAMRHQIAQVWALTGPSDADKHRWSCILDAEVAGQLRHFEQTGEFVSDQRAFTVEYLRRVHNLDVSTFPRTVAGLTIER